MLDRLLRIGDMMRSNRWRKRKKNSRMKSSRKKRSNMGRKNKRNMSLMDRCLK